MFLKGFLLYGLVLCVHNVLCLIHHAHIFFQSEYSFDKSARKFICNRYSRLNIFLFSVLIFFVLYSTVPIILNVHSVDKTNN